MKEKFLKDSKEDFSKQRQILILKEITQYYKYINITQVNIYILYVIIMKNLIDF